MSASTTNVLDMTRGPYFKVYAGFLRGKRINCVSDRAEHWFWRLYALADDFGNLRADKDTLYRDASPKRSVTRPQCERWIKMLSDAELISIYWVEDERYIQINGYTEFQSAGKNGRRVHRVKPPEADTRLGNKNHQKPTPDSVSGNPVNPGESRKSKKSDPHHTQAQNQAQTKPPPSPDSAAGAGATARVLLGIGVSARVAREFSAVPADTIIRHWLTLENAKRPAGALVSRLRDGTPPTVQPTPQAIAEACRAGVIRSVTLDGKTVEVDADAQTIGVNSHGVIIGDSTLSPERIGEAVFA